MCDSAIKHAANESSAFIYALYDPESGEVRYVGRTCDVQRRFKDHLNVASKPRTHKNNWIRQLIGRGKTPVLKVIEETNLSMASERERFHIAAYRQLGAKLTNSTDGGEGVMGLRHSEEARLKISEKGKGRRVSLETRQKLSQAMRRRYTPEVCKKYSEMMRGRKVSLETRRLMSASRKHMKFTPEHVENMRKSRLGKPAHNRGVPLSRAQKEAIAERHRKLSDKDAYKVLEMIAEGKQSQRHIAALFDVSPPLITRIKQGSGCYQKAREQWNSHYSSARSNTPRS